MRNIYKIFFIAVLCPLLSQAQSNFKPGFVVKLNGDTIKGTVDYKEWNDNPRQIKFKAANSGKVEQYVPSNIRAFGVNGFEYYDSFIVPISQDRLETGKLTVGIDTSVVIDTVFLKRLKTGKNVTLYNYIDFKERLYIQVGNNNAHELRHHLYIAGRDIIREDNTYIEQLKKLVTQFQPENTGLSKQAGRVAFYSSDIGKIISAINGNTGKDENVSKAHLGFRPFIGVGAMYSQVSNQFNAKYDQTGNTAYSSVVLPQYSAGVDMLFNENVGKWFVRLELNYTTSKANNSFTDIDKADLANKQTLIYNQTILGINPQLIYNLYNSKVFKAYIGAGFTFNFSTYSNQQLNYDFYLTSQQTETIHAQPPRPRYTFYNLTTRAGMVLFDKIEIYAGYSPKVLVCSDVNYPIRLVSYRAGVNFLFGKK